MNKHIPQIKELKAIILDMDGVLVDTEPLHIESFNLYMDDHNVQYPANLAESFIGFSIEDNVRKINSLYLQGKEVPVDEGVNLRDSYFIKLLNQKCHWPMPGVDEIITYVRQNNLKLALASSSINEHINIILSNLTRFAKNGTDYHSVFQGITAGDDVKNKKPAPDIYLQTIKKLNVSAENCIAVEDSLSGIKSARAAGIFVAGLFNPFIKLSSLNKADVIIQSLKEIPGLADKISGSGG